MTASCSQILGSGVRIYALPNLTCLAAPQVQQLKLAAAVAIGDTTVSVQLDSTFVAGAYTVSTSLPIYPGTILYFVDGTAIIPLTVLDNNTAYNVVSSASAVLSISRATVAISATAICQTYLAARLCTMKADTATSTTTQDNTTNCTGLLATKINTAFEDVLDMSGFPNGKDRSYYDIIEVLGRTAGTIFYMKDYDRQDHEVGIAQLTKASRPGAQAKGLVSWTMQAQVQSYLSYYGGSITLTAAQKLLANAERQIWGAELLKL